ncbi:methyltransferase small [Synergistales bacterium]|nr:methyltransferase small [Synergistales bacterium]
MKEVRPTSSRVLAALFNILGSVDGLSCADIFAGTGRVGLEALSRGAADVVFVEVLRDRAASIEQALPSELGDRATVLSLELRRGLAWLKKREKTFDVIFADPPYGEGWAKSLMSVKNLDELLKPNGIFIMERSTREQLTAAPPWVVFDERVYGETTLSFLKIPIQN